MIWSTQEEVAMFLEIFPHLANFIPLLPGERRLCRWQRCWRIRIGRTGWWRCWASCRIVRLHLVEPFAHSDTMDSHRLCDGAIGVALFRQRTHLLMLGLTCLLS